MKAVVFIIVLVAVGGLVVATNPSMNDYQNFIRQEIIRNSEKNIESPLGQAAGKMFSGFAAGLAANQTIRNDYIFFSTYELSFDKKRFRVMGILKRFVVLEAPR